MAMGGYNCRQEFISATEKKNLPFYSARPIDPSVPPSRGRSSRRRWLNIWGSNWDDQSYAGKQSSAIDHAFGQPLIAFLLGRRKRRKADLDKIPGLTSSWDDGAINRVNNMSAQDSEAVVPTDRAA